MKERARQRCEREGGRGQLSDRPTYQPAAAGEEGEVLNVTVTAARDVRVFVAITAPRTSRAQRARAVMRKIHLSVCV